MLRARFRKKGAVVQGRTHAESARAVPCLAIVTPVACFTQTKLNIRLANRRDLMGSSNGAESALSGPLSFFDSDFLTFPSLPIDAQPFNGYETAGEAARQDVTCMQTARYPTATGTPDSAAADGDAFHAALSLLPEDVLMEPLLGHDQVHPLASALAAARAECQQFGVPHVFNGQRRSIGTGSLSRY